MMKQMGGSYERNDTLHTNAKERELIVLIYDARGNGGGAICPTITGEHQNRVTDYTAIVVTRHER